MNEKKDLGEKILDFFENTTLESKIIFQKIFITLFEPEVGLFAHRNKSIRLNTRIVSQKTNPLNKNIQDIMTTNPTSESPTYTFGNPNSNIDGYIFEIGEITLYIMLDVNKIHKIEDFTKFKDDIEYAKNYEKDNTMIISLTELNKTQKEVPIFYYYKDLLFNLTKNKYVPHIERVSGENVSAFSEDIKDNNLPKIKRSDKLIKFYGFPKSSICKITYKMNKIKNTDLYCNYRIVI